MSTKNISTGDKRVFFTDGDHLEIPDLTAHQKDSWEEFIKSGLREVSKIMSLRLQNVLLKKLNIILRPTKPHFMLKPNLLIKSPAKSKNRTSILVTIHG